jgi:hypothetical protein
MPAKPALRGGIITSFSGWYKIPNWLDGLVVLTNGHHVSSESAQNWGMDEIIFTLNLPFDLPQFLEGPLFEIGYCLYQALFVLTGGKNILFSNEVILLMLAAVAWMSIQFFEFAKK